MSKTSIVITPIAVVALMIGAPRLKAEHPDLSGAWRLDVSNSTIALNPAPTGGTLSVSKHRNDFHIAEAMSLPRGEMSKEFEWKTDNRFHPVDGPDSGIVLAHWNHDTLIGDRRSGDGTPVESVTLSMRDSNTMVEEVRRPGQQDSTLVWKRQ